MALPSLSYMEKRLLLHLWITVTLLGCSSGDVSLPGTPSGTASGTAPHVSPQGPQVAAESVPESPPASSGENALPKIDAPEVYIGTASSPPQDSKPKPAQSAEQSEASMPPDEEPLLLLENDQPGGVEEDGADNSRCFVCHLNYQVEEIAVTHARQGIGCARCHGASDAHIADESWASGGTGTPPDIMYRREQVNPSCLRCHAPALTAAESRCPFFRLEEKGVCTDCHGNHRLKTRRCQWK